MPEINFRIVQKRFGEAEMLRVLVVSFPYALLIKLIYGRARIANEDGRVGGYNELSPTALFKRADDRHKGQYPCRGLIRV